MKIPERIEFGNIHRFGKMNSERPRPIIARFLYYSDLDKAKKAERNLRGTYFGVNEQFPPEIEEKRRKLYPIMKEEKKKKVVLIRDKRFVNNELVVPDEATHLEPRRSSTRPNKRTKVNSTPERRPTCIGQPWKTK